MELNREQIVKALECCASYDRDASCGECPYMYAELADNEICSNRMAECALALIKELTEENEKVKLEYAGFEAGAKHAVSFVKADTVSKYKSEIIEYYSKPKYQPTKEHPIKHTQIEHLFAVLDEKAKKMLEDT